MLEIDDNLFEISYENKRRKLDFSHYIIKLSITFNYIIVIYILYIYIFYIKLIQTLK